MQNHGHQKVVLHIQPLEQTRIAKIPNTQFKTYCKGSFGYGISRRTCKRNNWEQFLSSRKRLKRLFHDSRCRVFAAHWAQIKQNWPRWDPSNYGVTHTHTPHHHTHNIQPPMFWFDFVVSCANWCSSTSWLNHVPKTHALNILRSWVCRVCNAMEIKIGTASGQNVLKYCHRGASWDKRFCKVLNDWVKQSRGRTVRTQARMHRILQ